MLSSFAHDRPLVVYLLLMDRCYVRLSELRLFLLMLFSLSVLVKYFLTDETLFAGLTLEFSSLLINVRFNFLILNNLRLLFLFFFWTTFSLAFRLLHTPLSAKFHHYSVYFIHIFIEFIGSLFWQSGRLLGLELLFLLFSL